MMKIEIKSATAMRSFGTQFLQQVRSKMVKIITKDAEKQIRAKSQLQPQVDARDNGATIGVPPDVNDPGNQKLIQTENKTKAFKSTHENLANKAYVVNLFNQELK